MQTSSNLRSISQGWRAYAVRLSLVWIKFVWEQQRNPPGSLNKEKVFISHVKSVQKLAVYGWFGGSTIPPVLLPSILLFYQVWLSFPRWICGLYHQWQPPTSSFWLAGSRKERGEPLPVEDTFQEPHTTLCSHLLD